MADSLKELPTDETAPTYPELKMVDYLFEKDGSQHKINGLISEFKVAIFASILFVIFSLSIVDTLLVNIVSVANNDVIRTIIKAILFMVLVYVFQNLPFIRKKE